MSMPISVGDAWKAQPLEMDHKIMDLRSVQEVPASYAWTADGIAVHHTPSGTGKSPIPVVDLASPDAAQQMDRACRSCGVFTLINHGLPEGMISDCAIATAQSLFALPSEQKLKAARSADAVAGYGRQRLSSFYPKHMWSEGFTIVGSPDVHFRQLWPQDHTKFSDALGRYVNEMNRLAGRLLFLLLGSVGITEDELEWVSPKEGVKGNTPVLQLNSYPRCPDPVRAMGLGPHTDSSLITTICQDQAGLQILEEGLGWVTVPAVPNGLVVSVGDLLHILSNGVYKPVMHRAVVDQSVDRISLAYICGTPKHISLEPLEKFVTPTRPALYRSVSWAEYLGIKFKHFNDTMFMLRIPPPDPESESESEPVLVA